MSWPDGEKAGIVTDGVQDRQYEHGSRFGVGCGQSAEQP